MESTENLKIIQDNLALHQLEITKLYSGYSCHSITINDGFNSNHIATIRCMNSGGVSVSLTKSNTSLFKKFWWISEFKPIENCNNNSVLQLDLNESLEHIRHFIWANHNI